MHPLLKTDAYKFFHKSMYPKNLSLVYSNETARSANHFPVPIKDVTIVGIRRAVVDLIDDFNTNFFNLPKEETVNDFVFHFEKFTGRKCYFKEAIEHLHDLGKLPIVIKSLSEGTQCPIGIPFLTMYNTDPNHAWLTNYIETRLSAETWGTIVSATLAREFRKIVEKYGKLTDTPEEFWDWVCHDFSMRGMYGVDAAAMSGIGHLVYFKGTDTVPAYYNIFKYYSDTDDFLIGSSVPASEHSVQCSHYDGEHEEAYLDFMLTQYPEGIVSIVCDGFDFWKFMAVTVPKFKDRILARNGRVVFRPDSGNPVDIICGTIMPNDPDYEARKNTVEEKGAIEVLWDIFGGTEVEGTDGKMYKHLNDKVGLIYGDGISLERIQLIYDGLVSKQFSINNLVLGIGSFTYQHVTRDSIGAAVKATYVQSTLNNGKIISKNIFKNPKTKGVTNKKSAKGLLQVLKDKEGNLILNQEVSWEDENEGLLIEVVKDGVLSETPSFNEIRLKAKLS